MKIKKKYIGLSGYVRFKRCEINWSVYDWALPLSVDFGMSGMIYVRVLCVSIFIFK